MKIIKVGRIYYNWCGLRVYSGWHIDCEGEVHGLEYNPAHPHILDMHVHVEFKRALDEAYAAAYPRRWWQFWRRV